MEKLKIAIIQTGADAAGEELARQVYDDPVLLELCTPVCCVANATDKTADATVLSPTAEPAKCPADAVEVIVTDEVRFMLLAGEPTAEDIVKFRNILERDFDLRSPRIAILQEGSVQNPDLASQVTAEQGINTYGPYTVEQILSEDKARYFDGIVCAEGNPAVQRIIAELSPGTPVRYFAGREAVVTAVCPPVSIDEEEGLADVSALTHPVYVAIDVIHNRAFYDEALQNPLQKLYRDKREDRERGERPKVEKTKAEKDEQ